MRRVLILGASVRAAAESAVNADWQVTAADLFADRDLQNIADCTRISHYPDDFARIRKLHAALPVMYTGALENYPSLLDQFRSAGLLLGNDRDAVQNLRDPFRLQDVFANHGLMFPKTTQSPPASHHHHWLRKSKLSAGGSRILRCQPELANDDGQNCYYQEFANGTVCSASFVAANGQAVLLGITEMLVGCEWAGARDFVYSGSICRDANPAECEQWIAIGKVIAEEFGVVGLFGVDAVVCDSQVMPIEINPRYTASMEVLEQTRGDALVGLHLEACVSGWLPKQRLERSSDKSIGKLILYAKSDAKIPEHFRSINGNSKLADLPRASSLISAGQPMLSLIDQAECRARLMQALQSRSERIYDQVKLQTAVSSP